MTPTGDVRSRADESDRIAAQDISFPTTLSLYLVCNDSATIHDEERTASRRNKPCYVKSIVAVLSMRPGTVSICLKAGITRWPKPFGASSRTCTKIEVCLACTAHACG